MNDVLNPLEALRNLAEWSSWTPLKDAAARAPVTAGVYVARLGTGGPSVYVGMAGDRSGNGLRGRLHEYHSGRGMASGLGEAALDRALADPAWRQTRVNRLTEEGPSLARSWGRAAIEHLDLHLAWTTTSDEQGQRTAQVSPDHVEAARKLETDCLIALIDQDLWNRRLPAGLEAGSLPQGLSSSAAEAEPFDADLMNRLGKALSGRTSIQTLSHRSLNFVGEITHSGIEVRTPTAARKGTPRRVPAWLFNLAWDELRANGRIDRATLDQLADGQNTARAAAVFAILALLPGVKHVDSRSILLTYHQGERP